MSYETLPVSHTGVHLGELLVRRQIRIKVLKIRLQAPVIQNHVRR